MTIIGGECELVQKDDCTYTHTHTRIHMTYIYIYTYTKTDEYSCDGDWSNCGANTSAHWKHPSPLKFARGGRSAWRLGNSGPSCHCSNTTQITHAIWTKCKRVGGRDHRSCTLINYYSLSSCAQWQVFRNILYVHSFSCWTQRVYDCVVMKKKISNDRDFTDKSEWILILATKTKTDHL